MLKKKSLVTHKNYKAFICMAEKVRFELTVLSYTRVPGVHLKPLGHLSVNSLCSRC